jgi:septation ring formation regulator EzrA
MTPVTGEPSNGELGRLIGALQATLDNRFAELNSRLDKMVSLDVYTIQTTHVEQRLAQLQTEAQRSMDAVAKLEDDFEAYQRDEARRREAERQARLYQLIVPVALCIISSVIAIWAVVAK